MRLLYLIYSEVGHCQIDGWNEVFVWMIVYDDDFDHAQHCESRVAQIPK